MPWKETSPMDERMKFLTDYLKGHWSVAQLCRQYAMSRKTGYKWIARYETEGWTGMQERSRAPQTHPQATPAEIQTRLVHFRLQHPHWGPRKLLDRLGHQDPQTAWPAVSTGGDDSQTARPGHPTPALTAEAGCPCLLARRPASE